MKRLLEEAKRLQGIAGIKEDSFRFGNEVRPLETIPSLTNSDYSAMFAQSQNYPGEGADGHMYCPDCMCKTQFNEGRCVECSWTPLNEERHDVAMTMSNVQSIVQAATELLSKLQMAQESTELPAWIEDHIARADDLINQAAKGYYEEHNESEYEDQGEVRHYIREKETDSEPLYTDWDEYNFPSPRIVIHLKNGKKLSIQKARKKGSTRMYNAVVQAFRDDRYDILNPIIAAMIDKNNIKEKLSKKQQQLDVDKDGEIEASDLKKLRAKK